MQVEIQLPFFHQNNLHFLQAVNRNFIVKNYLIAKSFNSLRASGLSDSENPKNQTNLTHLVSP